MPAFFTVVCVAGLGLGGDFSSREGATPDGFELAASEDRALLASRKTVTVYADNEAAAIAEANRQHPKWTATNVKKTGNGRAYQVTMVMKR